MSTEHGSVHHECRYIEAYGHKACVACPNYSDTYPREKMDDLYKQWGTKMRAHVGEVKTAPHPLVLCPHASQLMPRLPCKKWMVCYRLQVKRPDPADKDANRRLKIGYLSSDLKRHPCAYFLEPFLRCTLFKAVTACSKGSQTVISNRILQNVARHFRVPCIGHPVTHYEDTGIIRVSIFSSVSIFFQPA